MPIKKGLVEENVSTKVLAALSTAFGREISFVDDLTYSEYETELKEAMMKVHPDRGGDEETFQILSVERDRIRGKNTEEELETFDREQSVTEKRTTISGAKLLPGTTFRPDDLKPSEVDEDSVSSNVNIADRLNNIADALGVIGGLFKLELNALKDKEEQDLLDEAEKKKKLRESELEAKDDDKKKKSFIKMPKPAKNFFNKLKKFFLNVALGAATLKILEWFKDPANKEKINNWVTWLENNAKAIFLTIGAIVGLTAIAGVVGVISSIVSVGSFILGIVTNPFFWLVAGGLSAERRIEKLNKIREEQDQEYSGKVVEDEKGNRKISFDRKDVGKGNWFTNMFRFYSQMIEDSGTRGGLQFALGGRPPVGEVATVGEQGRELFIADRPGTVIPNEKTEHVFDGGALLVAKSNVIDKASSISQKVGKKRTPNLIDLRGKSKGSSPNPTFSTGGQIEGVSSVDNSNIDLYSSSLSFGLTGAN